MDTNAYANVPMSCPRNTVTTRKLSDASVTPDVAIQIGEIEYHLHAIELRSRSKFFDRSLSTTWWRPENTHSGADGIKYRYKLVLDQKDPLMSLLEPVSPREDNSDDQPFPDVPGLAKAYSNMFNAFCNKGIVCVSIQDFEILVGLADLYCALSAISGAVELALLKWLGWSHRWQTFSLKLAILAHKLRLAELYHDAFVHLVGSIMDRNHAFWKDSEVLKNLPQEVRLQALEEYARISQLKAEIDREVVVSECELDWDLWGLENERKFYLEARKKCGVPLEVRRNTPPPHVQNLNELLKKNLKFISPDTNTKYLLSAKLAYYPWAETAE